jgi:predicted ATPase/DNA-binding SARP family transcriptional activator
VTAAEVRVLGPVEVVGNDGWIALASMQRRLIAALVVAQGRACTVDELVDALWGGRPPASGHKLVQVYVSQLRRALPAPVGIVTRTGAYALELPDELLDSARLERLVQESSAARREGNPALAASLAEQALRLWRGRPYGELAYDDFARIEVERLEALRLVALEERTDAQLALGMHAEMLGEILGLATDNPFGERLQEQAMLALYRCGRQSEALEHYDVVRRRFRDELGLEPGPTLSAMQRRILEHDPTLNSIRDSGDMQRLPEPPNPLVGRERELAALRTILDRRQVRLLVLTGAGGSGKTRLAIEAARHAASTYANGAILVELAPLRDPALVVPTIAQAVGVSDDAGGQPLKALEDALRTRELLLVLDNAEHLRAATSAFVELLSRAPRLTLLVTSRTVLHLSGEHVFPVAPLDADAALELFEQRARSLQPRFRVTRENETTTRAICARVDGLPLAIELAAARIRALPPAMLLERLAERLRVLSGGPHDVPARQQTLRETLDWSYDLLTQEERLFLARLSVFSAGATLDAVTAVCLPGREDDEALDLVERLLDASMVIAQEHGGTMRYSLLETVRQYAADRLRGVEGDDTPRRHAQWSLELAETAEPELSGDQQTQWFAKLEAEHDNLRAALAYLDACREKELQLRLTVALSRFWYVRGHLGEARRRLEEALADAGDEGPLLRRRALTAAGAIALLQGDYAAATAFSEAALDAARQSNEPRFVANALSNLGAIVLADGDTARASIVLEEAVALAREVGDTRIAALAINNLGDLALTTGEYERARPLFEESHALLQARGDTANLARSLFNRGAVDLMLGDDEAATARFRDGLVLASETGDKEDIAWCLEGLAALAVRAQDGQRASMLVGAAAGLLTRMGADFKPFERQLHETTETQAEALCGLAEHIAARERGASMMLGDAVDFALGAGPLSAAGP